MKKSRVISLLATLAFSLAFPVTASAANADPVHGPACSNIMIDGQSLVYTTFEGTTSVSGPLQVEQKGTKTIASCPGATYQVVVADAEGAVLGSQTFVGDGVTSSWSFSIAQPADEVWPETVYVTATSMTGNKVNDLVPNSGSIALQKGGSGGGGGFN